MRAKRATLELIGRVLLSGFVAAIAWIGTVGATSGIDTSWEVGLHMAANQHLRAGHDWTYTYGPGGFLAYPAWFGHTTGALSVLVNLALRTGFAFAVIAMLRRRIPTLVAASFAYVALIAWPFESPELAVLLVVALVTPVVIKGERFSLAAVCAIAAGGGVLATIKLNTAVIVLGVAALFALRERSVKWIGATVGSGFGGFLVMWLLLGQRVGDVVAYVRNGLEVVAGYTEASATETAGLRWHYTAAVLITIALCVAAWPRGRSKGTGLFAFVVMGWIGYTSARHAFVRHDGHALAFFSVACIAGAGIAVAQANVRAVLAALTVVASLVVSSHIRPLDGWRVPAHNGRVALTDLHLALTNSARPVRHRRAEARAALDPDAQLVEAARNRGVHVEPNDAVAAFAYEQRWSPLPSFQGLLTYTRALDELNVHDIATEPPAFVLLDTQAPAWDHRLADFTGPRTRMAILCNYAIDGRAGKWKMLHKRPSSGCGEGEVLSRQEVKPSVAVPVPAARHGGVVVARFTLPDPGLRHKLLSALWKPLNFPSIAVNGAPYRWLAAQSDGPFVMSVPPNAPFGPGVDGPAISSIAISGFGGSSARVEFDEVPIAP